MSFPAVIQDTLRAATAEMPEVAAHLAMEGSVPDFAGERPPNRVIHSEKARHRLAAYLFCTGMSQGKIAERLGVTAGTMSQWVRQPWFTDFVKHEMALTGRDAVSDIIKGAAVDSVFTLITLRDDEHTPATVRRQCCSDILDRAYGKAPQTIHSHHHAGDAGDISRVDDELKSLLGDRGLMQSLQPSQS